MDNKNKTQIINYHKYNNDLYHIYLNHINLFTH